VVAVGSLYKVWLEVPEDVSFEELQKSFRSYFGVEWGEALDVVDRSFVYNAFNNAYFAVRAVHSVENLTLDQVPEMNGGGRPLNIIVS
jgi:hypothetical protein